MKLRGARAIRIYAVSPVGLEAPKLTVAHERRVMSPAPFAIESCQADFGHVRVRFKDYPVVDKRVRAVKT